MRSSTFFAAALAGVLMAATGLPASAQPSSAAPQRASAAGGPASAPSPIAATPVVMYTDALSGPTSGGENGAGAYLSVFGKNFGPRSGLGSNTKVFIGGAEVANYRYLGDAKVAAKLGMQQITVQVGKLGGAALGTALPVKVVVGGVPSNTNQTFTPCKGSILFVSLTGDDASAMPGNIAKPWRYLQNLSALSGAYFAMRAGDHVVIRGGNWSDVNGLDSTWMRAGRTIYARNGGPGAWIHVTAYPGPINGNAIEDVHYTTPAGASGGFSGPWQAIAGTSGEYWSISNLRMDVAGGARRDAAPINMQFTAGPWRVVNNELGPWVAGSSPVLNAAGVSGHGDGNKILGNHIHNIEGTSELQNHGIYADSTAQNWEVAYNWIHDVPGGSLIQFNDNEGLAGYGRLPNGTLWKGFTGMRVHHNWLENAAKYGINYNDQGSTKLGAYEGQHWNNVIIGTRMPPLRINSTQPTQQLWFAFNTLYNCATARGGTRTGYVRSEGFGTAPAGGGNVHNVFVNNIFAFGPATQTDAAWFADAGGTRATAATYDFKRNLYAKGRAPEASMGDQRGLTADPLFANVAAGDFHLSAKSPVRNQGTHPLPPGFVVDDDFTGLMPRTQGGAPDLGAFEAP